MMNLAVHKQNRPVVAGFVCSSTFYLLFDTSRDHLAQVIVIIKLA